MPLAALAASWLFLFSLPAAAADRAPVADLHSDISWGEPVEAASSSPDITWSSLRPGADGAFSLFYGAGGLWHLAVDGSGRPLAAPRLLGREAPAFWASSGTAPYYAVDGSGNLWNAWDSGGTSIHLRKTDAQGRVAIADIVLAKNSAGVHGPSLAASPGGLSVGYTSCGPAGYVYVLDRLDGNGGLLSRVEVAAPAGAALLDGAFLAFPDGSHSLALSTASGGFSIGLDASGRPVRIVAVPWLQAGALPAMASGADGGVFLAWNGREAQGKGRIIACRVSDTGADSVFVTSSAEALSEPSVAVSPGGEVLLAWLGSRQGGAEALYSTSDPDAWEAYPAVQRMGLAPAPSGAPSPAVSAGRMFASWPSGGSVMLVRGYTYGFSASGPSAPAHLRPHGTAVVTVEILNRGGLADTLSLSLDTSLLPAGWSAELTSGEAGLPAGDGAASATVVLTGPAGAGGPASGLLRILAGSAGNPRILSIIEVPVQLDVRYRTEAALRPAAAAAAPGAAARFGLELRNLGDCDERFQLSAAAGAPFPVTIDRTAVTVPWAGTASAVIVAGVPPGAQAGESLELSVVARSLDSGAVTRTSAIVTVSPGVELGMSSESPVKSVVPGGAVEFSVAVQNDGVSPGPADVLMEVVSGQAGWSASVEPALLQLSAGERAEARLTVQAPPLASGRFVVRVVATSREWGTQASTTVTAIAVPLHGLAAGAATSRVGGPPGARLAVPLDVTNTGTEPEDATLSLSLPSGWSGRTFLDGALADAVTLAPGASARWTAFVASAPDALAGEYALGAVVAGRSGSRAEAPFTVVVEPMHELRLTSPTTGLRAAPGETAAAVLHLRNLGNAADLVSLRADAPAGWSVSVLSAEAGAPGPLDMGPGASADLIFEAVVPYSAPDSWTEMTVSATSRSGLRALLVMRIGLLLPDLSLSVAYSPPQFPSGRPVLATVTVSNTGEAPARNVAVEFEIDGAPARSERILLIPAGSSKTATFGWTPVPGNHLLRFEADAEHAVLERDEGNNLLLERVTVAGEAAAAPAGPAPLVLAAAGGGALILLAGAFAGGTETGKYWFLSLLFVPLYTKLRKDDILDHFVRGQVYGYIKANPGEHYNSIKKALALKNGTLVYHLKTLEREEFIKSVADGRFKRFYPREMKVPEPSDELVLRMNHIQHEILKIIRENPGISQKDIASRIGLSTPTVHYHINIMMSARVINVKRVGRETQCFVEEVEEGRAG
jgi:uncharacterized membrane protein/DNA-binding MarR family transcriptional regulator